MQEHFGVDAGSSKRASALHDDERAPPREAKVEPGASRRATNWRTDLGRVVEGEILPRLLLAHAQKLSSRRPEALPADRNLQVAEFAERLVAHDCADAWSFLDRARQSGRPKRELLLDLLGPAARHLGTLWESDDFDFLQVTVGLRRLREMLWRMSAEDDAVESVPDAPSALLMPAPGEAHDFGVAMVESFFRSDGWRIERGTAGFSDVLQRDWFDLVGFSLSCTRHVEGLREAVRRARAVSRNRSLVVLVGGTRFEGDEALARSLGADGAPVDAVGAVHLARVLVRRRTTV